MNIMERTEQWGDAHHPRVLDILRILLGVVLIAKGLYFISDTESVRRIITTTPFEPVAWAAILYIGFCHLIGGLLIVFLTVGSGRYSYDEKLKNSNKL